MVLKKLLKPFIKPKWQHKKPEIRKQGLRLLNIEKPEDFIVIEQLATADEDATVRCLAVKRLFDLDKLTQVALNDIDEKVCRTAVVRFNNLLAGIEVNAPALATRLERLKSLTDKKLIEFLSIQGVEVELRRAALGYLDRESVLGDIAINDPDQQVRMAAVDRINQQSTLERVLKKARSKDKKVSKQIKQKLASIEAEQERPLRIKQRAKQCCIELEAMISAADWGSIKTRLDEIEFNWQASKAEWKAEIEDAWDDELTMRYARAYEVVVNKLDEYKKQAEQSQVLEAERYPVRVEKRALCEKLEDKLLYFRNSDLLGTEIKNQIRAEIELRRSDWKTLSEATGQLSKQEEESLSSRFSSACRALEQHIVTIEQQQTLRDTLETLLKLANQQLERNGPVDLSMLKSLENRWEKLKHLISSISTIIPKMAESASDMNANFDLLSQRVEKLQQRYTKEQKSQQQNIEKFRLSVVNLQEALEQGKSQQAIKLQRGIQKLLKNMPNQDVQIVRKQGDERRYQALVKRIAELRDWKRWASTPLKETLVNEMEVLASELSHKQFNEIDINQLSDQIRQARDEWKKLGESEPDSAGELWERFNSACNRAYEPCQAYFDKQSQLRLENLKKRQVICNELEQFLSITNWENSDLGNSELKDTDLKSIDLKNTNWKKAERLLRVAQHEWDNTGSVEKKAWSAINKQFHNAISTLRQKTNEERARNADLKKMLIQQLNTTVETLEGVEGDSPELNEAIEKVKSLQGKWKNIGAASHESKLWKQFRASCDVVFSLRQEHFQAKDQEKKENLSAREAVCELIEALSGHKGDALKQSRVEFENAKKMWIKTGPAPKDSQNEVNKRYKKALELYEKMERFRVIAEEEQQLKILIHKAKLCEEVEFLIDEVIEKKGEVDDILEKLQLIQTKWQDFANLADEIERTIQFRFQNAIDELIGLSRNDCHDIQNNILEIYNERLRANLDKRQLVCIRMEIVAGIESPPESQQARMEYQVSQLADKMKQGDIQVGDEKQSAESKEALSLLQEWSVIGPIVRTELPRLTQRFDAARSVFLQNLK